jgi:DUF4097 and DUF4098 domain-containing protein YvlB
MTEKSARLAIAVLATAAVASTACVDLVGADLAKYVDRQEKRFAVVGQPQVELSTFDGAIEIRPWDKPEVLVVIEKRAANKAGTDAIEVHAEQNGDRVTVDVTAPKTSHGFFGWHNSRSARLIVSVPAKTDVVAKSGDGSIDIERIGGRFDLRSGDGSIRGRELVGDVKAHTGDGSIKLESLDGGIEVDTGDGSINVGGKFTGVRARTGDGSMTIHAASGSTAAADWDITTGDGSVVVEVPTGFGAEVDAHTSDGSVRLEDVTLSNVSGRLERNNVKGTLGGGGRVMRLRTGDGSITLRVADR